MDREVAEVLSDEIILEVNEVVTERRVNTESESNEDSDHVMESKKCEWETGSRERCDVIKMMYEVEALENKQNKKMESRVKWGQWPYMWWRAMQEEIILLKENQSTLSINLHGFLYN